MKCTGLTVVLALCLGYFPAFAAAQEQYSLANPYPVALIAVEPDLVLELVPLLRPYIPRAGHTSGVRSAGYIIVADHPRRVAKLRVVLAGLSADTLDKAQLRRQLDKQLGRRGGRELAENFTTATINLRSLKAATLLPVLRSLLSESGTLEVEKASNSLKVTDYPEILQDLTGLVKRLDGSSAG